MFLLIECFLFESAFNKDPVLIYIDVENFEQKFLLAEPHTLKSKSKIDLTIKSILQPSDFDINLIWSINPPDQDRFVYTEGYGTIQRGTNQTHISILSKDTNQSYYDQTDYFFKLDKVFVSSEGSNNYASDNSRVSIDLEKSLVIIFYLPCNYPFGYFSFEYGSSQNTDLNFTVTKSNISDLTESLRIVRYYGTRKRVMLSFDQIELSNQTEVNTTYKNFEFLNEDLEKPLDLSYLYQKKPPFTLKLKLTGAQIADTIPVELENDIIRQTYDILPKIGESSLVYIHLTEDKSIIEFPKISLVKEILLEYESSCKIQLELVRSFISENNITIYVPFVTVPFYKHLNGSTMFYPARHGLDYFPLSDKFEFKPESNRSTFDIQIMPIDLEYSENLDRIFKVVLISVENCDSCELGKNNEAVIYLKIEKVPFRSLLEWESESKILINANDLSIDLNVPVSSIENQTSLCISSRTIRPISIETELIDKNVNHHNQFSLRLTSERILFFDSDQTKKCIELKLELTSINFTHRCFNFSGNFNLILTIKYVINKNLSLYSNVMHIEHYQLNIINHNCSKLSIDTASLYKRLKAAGSIIDIENVEKEDTISLSIHPDADHFIKIPFEFSDGFTNFDEYNPRFLIDLELGLENFFIFPESKILEKIHLVIHEKFYSRFIIENRFTAQQDYILVNMVGLKNLNNINRISLKISIVSPISSNHRIFDFEIDGKNASQLQLDFYMFVESKDNLCSIISINSLFTQFIYLNSKRQLLIAFDNDLKPNQTDSLSSECVVNILYSITKTHSHFVQTESIYDFIDENADNFYYLFLSKNEQNIKEIELKSKQIYLDENDLFLINLTSLINVTSNKKSFFKSLSDSYLFVKPSNQLSNGLVTINAFFKKIDTESLVVNIEVSRTGLFKGVRVKYDIILTDSDDGSLLNKLDSRVVELDQNEQYKLFSIEFSAKILVDYADVLLFTNEICYLNDASVVVKCEEIDSKKNLTFIEPMGYFKIDSSLNQNYTLELNKSKNTFELRVDRIIGSDMSAKVYVSISLFNSKDIFLLDLIEFNEWLFFEKKSRFKPIQLTIKSEYFLYEPKIFFLFLGNIELETKSNNTYLTTSNILSFANRIELKIPPSDSKLSIATFSSDSFIVPIFTDSKVLNLRVNLCLISGNRIDQTDNNYSNNTASLRVRSAGYNDFFPSYLKKLILTEDKMNLTNPFGLALPNFAFKPVDEYLFLNSSNGFRPSFHLSIFADFRNELDYFNSNINSSVEYKSKLFYLYLDSPTNDVKIIEPKLSSIDPLTRFSPYFKLELRRFNFASTNATKSTILIGFDQNTLNKTIILENYTNLTSEMYTLKFNGSNLTDYGYTNNFFQLKFEAIPIEYEQNSTLFLNDILDCRIASENPLSCQNIINCFVQSETCDLRINFKSNYIQKINMTNLLIRIKIEQYNTALYDYQLFNVQIDPVFNSGHLRLVSEDNYLNTFGFDRESLFTINNNLMTQTRFKLTRYKGNPNYSVRIYYKTVDLSKKFKTTLSNGIDYYSASSLFDFEESLYDYVDFGQGELDKYLTINLRVVSTLISSDIPNYPRLFQVLLLNCTPNCYIKSENCVANVTLISKNYELWSLYKRILDHKLDSLEVLENDDLETNLDLNLINSVLEQTIKQQHLLLNSAFDNQSNVLIKRRSRLFDFICKIINSNSINSKFLYKFLILMEDLLFSTIREQQSGLENSNITDNNSRFINLESLKYRKSEELVSFACQRFYSSDLIFNGKF